MNKVQNNVLHTIKCLNFLGGVNLTSEDYLNMAKAYLNVLDNYLIRNNYEMLDGSSYSQHLINYYNKYNKHAQLLPNIFINSANWYSVYLIKRDLESKFHIESKNMHEYKALNNFKTFLYKYRLFFITSKEFKRYLSILDDLGCQLVYGYDRYAVLMNSIDNRLNALKTIYGYY